MEVPSRRGLFILGCFERRVTLYSQQVRALNLAHALFEEGRLAAGAKVLVIGGGPAGLTFAAGAARRGACVTVLERMDEVLSTFRGNHTRWLHPHIYEWPEEGSERECAELPLLSWSAGMADAVAEALLGQWRELQTAHDIRVHRGAKDIQLVRSDDRVHALTWNAPGFGSGEFSTVVFAVGYGEEIRPEGTATPSYWKNDELNQPVSPSGLRFLVSGIGDGGVVDLLRLRLQDFRHERIVRELLSDPELKATKSQLLAIERELSGRGLSDPELYERYKELPVPPTVDQRIRERLRPDTRVVLNSSDTYPLSSRASILNRFLLSRLLQVDRLEYRGAAIQRLAQREDRTYEVLFGSGLARSFDRVIVRHGARSALERDFPELWKASKALRDINELDQTREPLWPEQAFGSQPVRAKEVAGASDAPPPPEAPLIGRKAQLERIVRELRAPRSVPVVVLGPPGIGKSAIALAAVRHLDVRRRYGKRSYVVRLDGADTMDAVFTRLAREMDLVSASDLGARVLAELNKDDAPTLLVLDNADTPWRRQRPRMKELFRRLARMPNLALVITLRGRERPDFDGPVSRSIVVPRLTLEESRELFLSIADDVDPGHSDLSPMLRKMDGVALAVKLLAKQAEGVDLEITRQRWTEERTAMLRSRSGFSLGGCIEFSLNNPDLPEESRRLLQVLALLPAGVADEDRDRLFPRSAAAIAGLQKNSLVEQEGRRWRLLGVIREHVRKHRSPEPDDKQRTLDVYFSLARSLGPRVGKAHAHEALRRLSEESDNFEALLLMALGEGYSDAAIEAALQLSDYIRYSGRGSSGPLERARVMAMEQGATLQAARCLLALGRLHLLRRQRYELAQECLEEALQLFEQEGAQQDVASCLRELGHTFANLYEREQRKELLQQAEDFFLRALREEQRFQDPIGKAYCLHGLARIALFRNQREKARGHFNDSLQMFHEQTDFLGEAYSQRYLGELDEDDGRLLAACRLFEEVGELLNLTHCLRLRARLARDRGDLRAAERLEREAERVNGSPVEGAGWDRGAEEGR
jgi:tetratricopeptide (TPR) repeat protein